MASQVTRAHYPAHVEAIGGRPALVRDDLGWLRDPVVRDRCATTAWPRRRSSRCHARHGRSRSPFLAAGRVRESGNRRPGARGDRTPASLIRLRSTPTVAFGGGLIMSGHRHSAKRDFARPVPVSLGAGPETRPRRSPGESASLCRRPRAQAGRRSARRSRRPSGCRTG
jgi:hypothetical protein